MQLSVSTGQSAAWKQAGALSPDCDVAAQRRTLTLLMCMAFATVVLHLIVGNRYGFQRDELATLDDARRLAWGYVAYPPVTPFFGRLSLILFGTSLRGFRLFAAIAQAITVVLTGLMARDFGGRRGAQLLAAFAIVPYALAGGALMQYVSFDNLAWVLTAFFVVKLLRTEDPRWWMAVGASIGFGMMAKYGMAFFAVGIVTAFLLTVARRYLWSKWFAAGIAIAVLIFLPNFIWQAQHGFISLDFLRHIHARDVRQGRTDHFVVEQLYLLMLALPLAAVGLWFCLLSRDGRRFRPIGWMYLVPLALFVIGKGRFYYLAAAYPMLYAAGSAWGEAKLRDRSATFRKSITAAACFALTIDLVFAITMLLPLAPPGTAWFWKAVEIQGDYREEIGWPELVATVAQVRDELSPTEKANYAVLGTNYGEAGAVNLYGPQYGLPQAISGVNSFWARGYGDPPPATLIVLGLDKDFVDSHFRSCRLAAHVTNSLGVLNEETKFHPEIFVCGSPLHGWPEFWKKFRYFG